MPIVFHLSTWATGRLPLAAWLITELRQRYGVSQKLAQAWIDADVVLPLLDGLDEVRAEDRDACVDAISALRLGGFACLQHLALRFALWRSGALAWNIAAFLDEAADRILLRKVGGGYIFIHRLLLEYFAGLEDEDGRHTLN
jgi:predicted NACHT family NTPase